MKAATLSGKNASIIADTEQYNKTRLTSRKGQTGKKKPQNLPQNQGRAYCITGGPGIQEEEQKNENHRKHP